MLFLSTRPPQAFASWNSEASIHPSGSGHSPDLFFRDTGLGFDVLDAQQQPVGSVRLGFGLTPEQVDQQKSIFCSLYKEFTRVRDNPRQDEDPSCRNAQYIPALKEKFHLDNGAVVTVQGSGSANELSIQKRGDEMPVVIQVEAGQPTDQAVRNYIGKDQIRFVENDSRSLGVTVQCAQSTIQLGDTGQQFSIQSIAKLFAFIAGELCDEHLFSNGNEEIAAFNLRSDLPVALPQGFEKKARPEHGVPVKAEYSSALFNERQNLHKSRDPATRETTYSLANAMNNYGAVKTVERLPTKAVIDGRMVEGPDNIVRAVMEALMGPGKHIEVNQHVFHGELDETRAEHVSFLQKYEEVYEPAKRLLFGNEPAVWKQVDAMQENAVDRHLDNVLQAIKQGRCGPALKAAANDSNWEELADRLASLESTDWERFKQVAELAKLHFPDNLTRTLWLMGKEKEVYGDAPNNTTNLQIAEIEMERSAGKPDRLGEAESAFKKAYTTMRAYTRQCALSVSCEDLATLSYPIASGGLTPDGRRVFSVETASRVLEQMKNAGLYDQSGKIGGIGGTPFDATKSGVGGALACAVTRDSMVSYVVAETGASRDRVDDAYKELFGEHGISASFFSRPLNASGNSANGLELEKGVAKAMVEALRSEVRTPKQAG